MRKITTLMFLLVMILCDSCVNNKEEIDNAESEGIDLLMKSAEFNKFKNSVHKTFSYSKSLYGYLSVDDQNLLLNIFESAGNVIARSQSDNGDEDFQNELKELLGEDLYAEYLLVLEDFTANFEEIENKYQLSQMAESDVEVFAGAILDIMDGYVIGEGQESIIAYGPCQDSCREIRDAKFKSNRNASLRTIAGSLITRSPAGVLATCIWAYKTQEEQDDIARMEYRHCLEGCNQ